MQTGGIILCGGKSTRMGLPKATLPFGGELMLQRVVRLLGQIVQPIVVVAAAQQKLPDLPAKIIVARDQQKERGPLEGIYAGLLAMQGLADAAYITSCDVPLLQSAFVQKMIALLGQPEMAQPEMAQPEMAQPDIAQHDIAVPVDGKFHHPLAAVYRTSLLPQIETLLEQNRMRPFFLFDQVNTLRVPIEQLREVDPQLHTLANLNRPEDYEAALKIADLEPPGK